ncbi:MAG: FAD-dependent oxidoreductase [Ruminococcaceae bacterium]|nr:FAD-dependent oxidoreductase [Oscillospiraceae bacterium]
MYQSKYDAIVVGGGLTGVAAAVAAARGGLSVLLIERDGCLGGAMANGLVYPFMKYWLKQEDEKTRCYLSRGMFSEMRERLATYAPTDNDQYFNTEFFKILLDDMTTEAGVSLLFHATVIETVSEGRCLKAVRVATKSGVLTIEGNYIIDASGDGDVMALSGCDFQLGRDADGFCQPMTNCFRVGNADVKAFLAEKPRLQEIWREEQKAGKITNPRENLLVFTGIGEGILHFNTTRVVKHDPTNAFEVSCAEVTARHQIAEIMRFLREHSPACKNAVLLSSAWHIGVRESRKLRGVHILTAEELKTRVHFEDTIAIANYSIDIHSPTGTGTELYYFKPGEYYEIPYRSLLPREYDNLLVAGRCISATHEAQSAIRIMPICANMGEAAGWAVAQANTGKISTHQIDVPALQKTLLENGAVLGL